MHPAEPVADSKGLNAEPVIEPEEILFRRFRLHMDRGEYAICRKILDSHIEQHQASREAVPDPLEEPVSVLGLPVRTSNRLEDINIFTVGQLLNTHPGELGAISGCGQKSVEVIIRAATKYVARQQPRSE